LSGAEAARRRKEVAPEGAALPSVDKDVDAKGLKKADRPSEIDAGRKLRGGPEVTVKSQVIVQPPVGSREPIPEAPTQSEPKKPSKEAYLTLLMETVIADPHILLNKSRLSKSLTSIESQLNREDYMRFSVRIRESLLKPRNFLEKITNYLFPKWFAKGRVKAVCKRLARSVKGKEPIDDHLVKFVADNFHSGIITFATSLNKRAYKKYSGELVKAARSAPRSRVVKKMARPRLQSSEKVLDGHVITLEDLQNKSMAPAFDMALIKPGAQIRIGTSIYTIESKLGAGGFATAFKVVDSDNNAFAVKLFDIFDKTKESDMLTEFNLQKELANKNIAEVYNIAKSDGFYMILMEYVEGETLTKAIKGGGFGPKQFNQLVEGLSDALSYLHEKGIYHLDIKLENILIKPDGTIKLIDFGISIKTSDDGQSGSNEELYGQRVGTLAYMSPEVIKGGIKKGLLSKADAYAMGVVLLKGMFNGKDGRDWLKAKGKWKKINRMPYYERANTIADAHYQYAKTLPDGPEKDSILALLNADPSKRPEIKNLAIMMAKGETNAR